MFCFNLVQSWASDEQHWPSFNETKYHFTRYVILTKYHFTRYVIFDFLKSLDLMKKYK
jgi:hypothetical protein